MLSLLALLNSCGREIDAPEEHVYKTIHYCATAQGGIVTRAGLDNDHYIFEAGDRLFVSHEEENETVLYGFLTLISGAGESIAYFEGDLACDEDFKVLPGTSIKVTLVSSNDQVHTVAKGKITNTSYTNGQFAANLEEAVRKFSDFTCTTTYDATTFVLEQKSTFLVSRVKLKASEAPSDTEITAVLYNNSNESLRTVVVNTESAGTGASKISFVMAFPGDEVTLSSAKLSLSWTDHQQEFTDISDGQLAANNYYTISRSSFSFDGFRIKATVADTRVTFHSNYIASLYYSTDGGDTWIVPTSSAITLANVDDEICVLGRRDNYKNANQEGTDYGSPLGNPLFSTADNKLVYICGNIMSLLCRPDAADNTHPENWTFGTSLPVDAFNGTFSKGKNSALFYIDIDNNDPLILPNYTAERCYKGMFRMCTSLTHAPDLPATTLSTGCYNSMFRGCSNLIYLRCYANVYTGDRTSYNSSDYNIDFMKSVVDKFFEISSTNNSGTIYCHPDMVEYWTNCKVGNTSWLGKENQIGSIPSNWSPTIWSSYPN